MDPVQVRVLGALMEKEIATPETYPLSLNALVLACNQRSSRDPVMELTEEQVRQALHGLEDLGLTAVVRDSRVPKYEHRIRTVLNLRRDETAVLCLLLLRGAQTPGELRTRADRLYSFDDLEAVQSTLERMTSRPTDSAAEGTVGGQRTGPLVVVLARQPGSREARFMHLLGGPVAAPAPESGSVGLGLNDDTRVGDGGRPTPAGFGDGAAWAVRLSALEAEVNALRKAVALLELRCAELERNQ